MTQLALLDDYRPVGLGIVYCMTDGYLIKIGWTSRSVKQRSGELRAYVIASTPGSRADERRFHALFSHYRVAGEWFRLPDDGRSLGRLRMLINEWGGPAGLMALDQVIAANLKRAA
jgi:hypothetical protein